MIYLFIQTFFWIALAVMAGIFIGWFVWGRKENNQSVETKPSHISGEMDEEISSDSQAQSFVSQADENVGEVKEFAEIKDEFRPEALEEPIDGKSDDLTQINGVGPKINETLHSLGIHHFSQIAKFSRENIAWVDNYLSFKGRIDREDWVGQAKKLAKEKKENI